MGLKIAELEGDAVFFYRVGDKPSEREVYQQIKEMYEAFHMQLKIHQRDRICSCGACTSTNELKLKFVSHYGDVVERTIHDHFQLMGSDVTLVHKFLKNNIDNDEYILLSEEAVDHSDGSAPEWIELNKNVNHYQGVGDVSYSFSDLSDLKLSLPKVDPKREIETIEHPIELSVLINTNIEKVYSALIDAELKLKWAGGLRDIIQEKDRVHRIGSSHDCVLPLGTIHVETVDNIQSKDSIIFTEFTDANLIFPAFYQRFILTKLNDNQTDLKSEVHYKGNYFKETILRLSMKRILFQSLTKLKNFVENNEVDQKIIIDLKD